MKWLVVLLLLTGCVGATCNINGTGGDDGRLHNDAISGYKIEFICTQPF
jgi:hypothetical protein